MTIMTFEIVNNYRQRPTSLGYPIHQITLVVSITTVVSCNMAMVLHFISPSGFGRWWYW